MTDFTTEEDTDLLMAASQVHVPASTNKATNNNTESNSNTDALARSNLLRLEITELIREATLHLHPHGNESSIHYEAKWAPIVRGYISNLSSVLTSLDKCSLSPDVCLISSASAAAAASSATGGGVKDKGMKRMSTVDDDTKTYRVPLQSDKFLKSLPAAGTTSNSPTPWNFPFSGKVKLVPVGSYAHIGNAGLTNRHANGNVLPTLDLAILVKGGDGDDAFVGGKDYLNHRYTDKLNILAVHIGKQLSHKKHRSKIGSVHLTRLFGDARKAALLLTPPNIKNDDTKKGKDKKKKRKRGDDDDVDGGKKMKNKLRFRVRLIFGVEQQQHQDHSNHHEKDDDDSSMDEEVSDNCTNSNMSFHSWVPTSRLFPNRCNNRNTGKTSSSEPIDIHYHSTPHYNNALAESLHLQSTTNLINNTVFNIFVGSNTVVTPSTTFHETLLLIKIWALQRGLLRGHDSFTTTTIALILVYLYRTKSIGKRMGSVQAFTTFMKFWSEVDWLGEDAAMTSATTISTSTSSSDAAHLLARKIKRKAAFVIPAEGRNESQTIAHCLQARYYCEDIRNSNKESDENLPFTLLDCYKVCFTTTSSSSLSIPSDCHSDSPILLDPTMTINYLSRLSPSFVRESRAEAYTALQCIHDRQVRDGGAFRKLFLETNRFWTRYDAYVRISLSCVPKLLTQLGGQKKQQGNGSGRGGRVEADIRVWGRDVEDLGYDESVCRGIVEVLNRALGDRITAVRAFTSGNGDVRKDTSPSSQSMENISTKAIADSDQFVAVPIRGGSSSATSAAICGFAAKLRERPPEPPVRLNQDDPCLVVGLRIDPDASRRIVDRGPPAENVEGSSAFTTLWGDHAQLRRFQDGAIVRAVVWNLSTFSRNSVVEAMPQFAGMDRSMGGIVEKVVQRIIELHFTDSAFMKAGKAKQVSFELRNMVGFVDGVLSSPEPSPVSDSFTLHKNVMSAFDSLAAFLRENSISAVDNSSGKERTVSRLGLPLKIEEVEPLSPVLRYSSLFPPLPHPLLGGIDLGIDKRKVSGAVVGSPVLIQIRFQGSSRWPSSLNAMGAAKCAMLIRLAEGIEKMKQSENLDEFDGPIDVTPTYLDIGYRGYSWRIIVRADEELRMLKNLRNPTAEAKSLRLSLINRHVRGSMHHSLIHAIHTKHPSSSLVSRLAHRWVASHMLSGMIPLEAIELIVAKIYTDPYEKVTPKMRIGTPPTTTTAGLLRFLQTIYTHDWATEPMIVDPQSHITARDRESILAQFHRIRGPDLKGGPAMYIISPTDYDGVEEMTGSMVVGGEGASEQVAGRIGDLGRVWSPTYTSKFPERVVLSRAAALARCSHDHLTSCLMNGSSGSGWVAAFQESSASLTSYSALLRVDSIFVTDTGCCSTNADSVVGAASKQDSNIKVASPFERSLLKRYSGPKDFRSKIYKNLVLEKGTLHEWHPVKSLVSKLRSNYSEYAIFFYNEFAPDIIAMIWRPAAFAPKPFSVMISEFQSPVLKFWKDDSLVITNAEELISEIGYVGRNILSDIKLLDYRKPDRLTHQSAI